MKVLICVKQVPDVSRFAHRDAAGRPPEDSTPLAGNPVDKYALEAAARLKDRDPETHMTALSLGPRAAERVLRDSLALAADEACLLCDARLDGADSLAVSYALSAAVRALEAKSGVFDIIFCGGQAADSDEGHTAPQLAEWLGRPHVSGALVVEPDGARCKVSRETQAGVQIVTVPRPCVIAVTKSAGECRYPDILRLMEANRAEIPVLTAADLPGLDLTKAGPQGSPTRQEKLVPAPEKPGRIRIEETSDEASARELYRLLNAAAIL